MSNRGNTAFLSVWGGMGSKEDHKHNGDNQLQSIDELRDCNVEEYRSRSGRTCQQGWRSSVQVALASVVVVAHCLV